MDHVLCMLDLVKSILSSTYSIDIGRGECIDGSESLGDVLYRASEQGLCADIGNQTSTGVDLI